MTTQSTRRTFVGGAVVAATALGSLALFGGEDAVPLKSGVIDSKAAFAPVAGQAAGNSVEIQRWAAAIGQPIRVSSETGGTTGRIHQVLSAAPRKVPAGVREQSFIVYFELDKTHVPLTDRIYDIAAPVEGLTRLYMSLSQDRGAKAIMLAIFA